MGCVMFIDNICDALTVAQTRACTTGHNNLLVVKMIFDVVSYPYTQQACKRCNNTVLSKAQVHILAEASTYLMLHNLELEGTAAGWLVLDGVAYQGSCCRP